VVPPPRLHLLTAQGASSHGVRFRDRVTLFSKP
jgi:hypothetical protein